MPSKFRTEKIPRNRLEFRVSRNSQFRSSEVGTEFREVMKFYETANKSGLSSSVFCSRKWFGTDSPVFSVPKIGSERNSEVFSFPKMVRNGIPRFFLFRKWFETEFRGFFSSENSSERNSEIFLFRETSEILTELPSVPSCSVFRGIIFCQKMATLCSGTDRRHIRATVHPQKPVFHGRIGKLQPSSSLALCLTDLPGCLR